jgi:ribosome-associated protein YbcJ (S4-like RNA binding protein)
MGAAGICVAIADGLAEEVEVNGAFRTRRGKVCKPGTGQT